MGKTVYVIGAGFSKGLNAPLQSELIKSIFELDIRELPPQEEHLYLLCRENFTKFLEEVLFIDANGFNAITLEDIYTPIDRCIIDNASFRTLNKLKLQELRQDINALLIMVLRYKLRNLPANNYADKLAKYLVDIKRKKGNKSDPFAILSLNWDIILDNALNHEINSDEGVLDYCCFITPFMNGENIVPGLMARGQGKFNVKLLKMHGSMNWLQCQRCQRLFVTFNEKIAIEEYITRPTCRLCQKNFENTTHDRGGLLTSQLIMPTFLKDFNNVQLKLIWQNAGIELSEATKIVFMGYSFPAADFEMRQLLARFVRHGAKIEVVLKEPSPITISDSPESRYKSFFGKRDLQLMFGGVEQYIAALVR